MVQKPKSLGVLSVWAPAHERREDENPLRDGEPLLEEEPLSLLDLDLDAVLGGHENDSIVDE